MLFQITACSSTSNITTPEQINEITADNDVFIVFKSGSVCDATAVYAQTDSTQFVVVKTNESRRFPTTNIKAIQTTEHGKGAIVGFFFGSFIGAVTMGILVSGEKNDDYAAAGDIRQLFVLGSATLGGIIGVTAGAIKGYQNTYVVVQDTTEVEKKVNYVAP